MTEQEWLECTDDAQLWESDVLWDRASERKYQLFAVAWCRRIWHLFPNEWSRHAVETLERVAEGLCDEAALQAAWDLFESLSPDPHADLSETQAHALSAALTCVIDKEYRLATVASAYCQGAIRASQRRTDFEEDIQRLEKDDCDLIRELFGNPFRPIAVNPSWLMWNDGTVIKLAQGIYNDLAFDRLPILADALEEAGCNNAHILAHCRQPGEHVRGCWVVDLILGKE